MHEILHICLSKFHIKQFFRHQNYINQAREHILIFNRVVHAGQQPHKMLSSQNVPSGQSDGVIFGMHSTKEQSGHTGKLSFFEQNLE